ncbi:MAG TPA: PKD domain-containing protein [Thermoanaerobaculia bacterium]|nr:PKD domain-containing protein [Thermoanaerobaculia bacterium]
MPSNRWGDLQPAAILGDRTAFPFHNEPERDHPFWFSVDIENNFMFVATGRGLEVWDLRSNPAAPSLLGYGYAAANFSASGPIYNLFPIWQHTDKDWFLTDLDAPVGVDDILAIAGQDQGLSIWNTADKTRPTVFFQDRGTYTEATYTATLGGTQYAFALGDRAAIAGVYLYDMSAARQYNRCGEDLEDFVNHCPGVYRGKLPGPSGGSGIDGVGNFLVVGRASGFDIWNVANPMAPIKVMSSSSGARGVAIWESGNKIYLATVRAVGVAPNSEMRIFDVSCIRSGLCSPTPLAGPISVPGGGTETTRHVTFSMGAGKPFLYLGGEEQAACAVQREYLFDVSNPANPVEITPKVHPEGYWGWYYELCPNEIPGNGPTGSPNPDGGFNWVAPLRGKFNGDYFYRAAYSILDVHKLAAASPPVADFSWGPAQVYPGVPVAFTDLSTGSPNAWTWTFEGGSPASAGAQNPSGIVFDSVGAKNVHLRVNNPAGVSQPKTKPVNVLSPQPAVAGVTANLTAAKICQPVTFTASATGRPALSYQWTVLDAQGNPLAAPNSTGTGNPFTWNTQAVPPGNYEVRVVVATPVANDGSATFDTYQVSPSVPAVQLAALPALPASFTATNDPFTSGTVSFHVNVPGATEWRWDFDDDGDHNPETNPGTWTSDPIAGPNPTHTYASIGTRQVRVAVRNCLQPVGLSSDPLVVNVTQVTPLKAQFSVSVFGCSSGVCFIDANAPVKFNDSSTGAELWDYDWDGNGTFEDAGNTKARDTHSYPSQGSYTPKLRVRRGTESDVFTLPETLVVGPPVVPQTPSISVSGPTSGQPNQALSYTATASNCSPASTWSWSATGGTVAGSGSTVSITFSSNGSKTVSVTNSGCAGATGSRSVTISTGGNPPPPPPPPPGLRAAYVFSPAAPVAGQAIAFDATSSGGSPTGYVWDFGDGTAFGSGAQVQHTYAKEGSYKVQLSVTGPGSCPPAPFCENATTKTVVVGNGVPPLVPAFQTNATCISEFGLEVCNAETGKAVQFTDASTGGNITTRTWSFGDGQTGSGSSVSHAFAKEGTFTVTLTIGNGSSTASATRTFKVTGPDTPASQKKVVVLPWIAQTRGALVQSSDLYIYNPASGPIEVSIQFLKRGTPEANPPKVTRTIQPGATLFTADVLSGLFNRENIAGFITVTAEEGAEPIITSFNTTFQDDGTQFGQTIPGVSLSQSGAKATQPLQHLVGLNDNTDRLAYFGVSNPGDTQATYRLRFFDHLGTQIGQSADMPLSPYGQQQFQIKQIRDQFGISDEDDYRVEVETKVGGQLFPYAANLRLASEDPSFVESVSPSDAKAYLVGVFNTPGIGGSRWQSDVVLSNPSNQVVITEVRFLSVGVQSAPTQPVTITLQPGETQRIDNVLATKWGLNQTVGVLLFESNSPNGSFPVLLGEVYDNAKPEKRFGQTMTAQVAADVAGNGKSQILVGLRQDSSYRSTVTLYNPSAANTTFDVVYRGLDGKVLGTLANQALAPGKARQINPGQHPLPAQGVPDGFTVEIKVKGGSLLATGQVVNNRTNDPAFIRGRVR